MKCSKCGADIEKEHSFCKQCGAENSEKKEAIDAPESSSKSADASFPLLRQSYLDIDKLVVAHFPKEISGLWVFYSSIATALAADLFLLRHNRGMNILIVSAAVMAIWLWPIMKKGIRPPALPTFLFFLISISMFFQSSGPADRALYPIWLCSIILYCVSCRDRLLGFEGSAIVGLRNGLSVVPRSVSTALKSSNSPSEANSNLHNAFLGIVVALPIALVLLVLLSQADKVFAKALSNVLKNIETIPSHIAWIFILSAVLMYFTGHLALASKRPADTSAKPNKSGFPLMSSVIVLATVIAVVAAFLFIHMRTLALSEQQIKEIIGIDYYVYIRRGFAELLACEAIIGLVTLYVLHTKEWKASANAACRTIAWTLLFLAACLSVSCAMRLAYYVTEYGITLVRYMNAVGIAVSFASLVFLAMLVVRPMEINKSFGVIFKIFLVFFTLWSCSLPVRVISWFNAEKCLEGKPIELRYLEYLGPDAYPAIAHILEHGMDMIHPTELKYIRMRGFKCSLEKTKTKLLNASILEWNPMNGAALRATESISIIMNRRKDVFYPSGINNSDCATYRKTQRHSD